MKLFYISIVIQVGMEGITNDIKVGNYIQIDETS